MNNTNAHLFQSWATEVASSNDPLLPVGFQRIYGDTKEFVITNSFSINMLDRSTNLCFIRLDETEARWIALNFPQSSAVGHADTAAVLSSVLGTPVPMNRTTLQMQRGVGLLVGQYKGPRLEEGTTKLPEGATIEWWLVRHM
jgi:hypothetical protein